MLQGQFNKRQAPGIERQGRSREAGAGNWFRVSRSRTENSADLVARGDCCPGFSSTLACLAHMVTYVLPI